MFVTRDENGNISRLCACEQYENQEFLDDNHEDILNFGKPTIKAEINAEARAFLNSTDWQTIRFLEQVLLPSLNINLPEDMQLLLNERQEKRRMVDE